MKSCFSPHLILFTPFALSGSSSVGRASAFQAECREFEPRLPLHFLKVWLWLTRYKSGLACVRSGENHTATLQFRHCNYEEKRFEIALYTALGVSKTR